MIRQVISRIIRRTVAAEKDEPVEPSLGRLGEVFAARSLEREGLRILAKNVKTACGEIDLVAMQGDGAAAVVVFAEVKTRRAGGRAGTGEDAVNRVKKDRLARCASAFLARSRHLAGRTVRFDVVAVEAPRGVAIEILRDEPDRMRFRWIQAAFHVDPRYLGMS